MQFITLDLTTAAEVKDLNHTASVRRPPLPGFLVLRGRGWPRVRLSPLQILCLCILAIGVLLTSRALYLHAKAELAGVLIRRAWSETIAHEGAPHRPWPWADMHPIARLRIPRLGYDEIVLDNASARTLAFGPAALLSGAQPGAPGNLVLAGHRTSWFRELEAITPGDRLELQWFDAKHATLQTRAYAVQAIDIVSPENLKLVSDTGHDTVTLVTCYPFGIRPTSPQRFVVHAEPLNVTAPASNSR